MLHPEGFINRKPAIRSYSTADPLDAFPLCPVETTLSVSEKQIFGLQNFQLRAGICKRNDGSCPWDVLQMHGKAHAGQWHLHLTATRTRGHFSTAYEWTGSRRPTRTAALWFGGMFAVVRSCVYLLACLLGCLVVWLFDCLDAWLLGCFSLLLGWLIGGRVGRRLGGLVGCWVGGLVG